MAGAIACIFARFYNWQNLLFVAVSLLHIVALAAVFNGGKPVEQDITPPQLQGVIVQTIAIHEPQPVVEPQPLPEPPKPQKPPEPKVRKQPVPEKVPLVPQPDRQVQYVEPEPPAESQVDMQQPAEPVAPPPRPAAAPVKAPDATAAHLQNPAPAYPVLSRKLKEQGTVLLRLLVLANGQVGEVHLEQSSGYPRLDDSALQAVKRWHYSPAIRHGKAVDYWHLQPVLFSLN